MFAISADVRRIVCAFILVLGHWLAVGGQAAEIRTAPIAAGPLPASSSVPAPPVQDGRWIRPASTQPAQPVWGHADGLRVGLHPLRGPRGLLRIYAPYLGHEEQRMINFIAVEPIAQGHLQRGFSELEYSRLDNTKGKRFWSSDDPADAESRPSDQPARGIIERKGEVELLRVHIHVERFDNGAEPYLRLTFRSDRPHEVGIATFSRKASAPMASCIITATMGNYARLRRLHLADRAVLSKDLWPSYRGDAFTPHAIFGLKDLFRTPEGHVLVTATTDEKDPQQALYASGTAQHWRYTGKLATQYWRCEDPQPSLAAAVNGRFTYWAGTAPIPGGISYENFELEQPHREGNEVWFGVAPKTPEELGIRSR